MGFLGNLLDALSRPSLVDPVRGSAQVVSVSMPPSKSGGGGMCVMDLVITIPDQPSVAVRKASLVRLARWPQPGMSLPLLAERTDPRRYRILWDEVPSGRARGAVSARELADRLNADRAGTLDAAPAAPAGIFRRQVSVTINGEPATRESLAAIEALTGLDLDGDGRANGHAAGSAPPDDGPRDRDIEQRLRQLQVLRERGLISDDEYRTKRAAILASL